MRVLLTSTSFQSFRGRHTKILEESGLDVDMINGPLEEEDLLPIIDQYNAVLMGDDEYSRKVLEKGSKLKVLSKYGTGLDRVDLEAAKEFGIKVCNVTDVNQYSVAEHVFALLLSFSKNIPEQTRNVKQGQWNRITGIELKGKKIGIIGLGRIGKTVAQLSSAFRMNVGAWDIQMDMKYCLQHDITIFDSLDHMLKMSEIISLHLPLTSQTRGIIDSNILKNVKKGFILINTARGALVNEADLTYALQNDITSCYLADVLEKEPVRKTCPLNKLPNSFITPHVASRTRENIQNQGEAAVKNLIKFLDGI